MALKKSLPSAKSIAKQICRAIYYCGLGDFWYEDKVQTNFASKVYTIWCIFIHTAIYSVFLMEVAASFKKGIPDAARLDAIFFTIAHSMIIAKYLSLPLRRREVKQMLRRMFESNFKVYEKLQLDQQKKIKIYILVLCLATYGTIVFTMALSWHVHFLTGAPFRTLVTYWPDVRDPSTAAAIGRSIILVIWCHLATMMCVTDSLAIANMVSLEYKFRVIQQHYLDLEEAVTDCGRLGKRKTRAEVQKYLKNGFVVGIRMHVETLWCARAMQGAIGKASSIQVIQSIMLLAIVILKFFNEARSVMSMANLFSFAFAMLVLTAIYMFPAGDMTHQAGLVSEAIYSCGWHQHGDTPDLRTLLVLAISRGHIPVIFTAFNIFDLSYGTFVKVVRTSYSVAAVLF